MRASIKIQKLPQLQRELKLLRQSGKKIVFTNGCFDILHMGHVHYLSAAKQQGDALVVGLNSDASVRKIKGRHRPIVPQDQRAIVLAGLESVDYVTVFDEPDPFVLIQNCRPDVLVKGEDWTEENIIGADLLKANGGIVVRAKVVSGVSTSGIIERIIHRYC
jgi:D-beta-D-heptose 7-phosphate kinase/D-beta-D-heptose 1-phosphate adenosyltransferase